MHCDIYCIVCFNLHGFIMRSMLINDAAEYNAATDRVNSALQTLRDEMVSECFKSRVVLAVINT